ncbi:hypothetical protein Q1695_010982 [Nippostrongylus brasiliensis]|nr:hypothetical protein Q1695_010982 [Nippostrongylus brasiliensis]
MALVFVAVHGQGIDTLQDLVANKPVARARRGAVMEELMEPLNLMARPLGPTNGRQRRSPYSHDDLDKQLDEIERERDEKAAAMKVEESMLKYVRELKQQAYGA